MYAQVNLKRNAQDQILLNKKIQEINSRVENYISLEQAMKEFNQSDNLEILLNQNANKILINTYKMQE